MLFVSCLRGSLRGWNRFPPCSPCVRLRRCFAGVGIRASLALLCARRLRRLATQSLPRIVLGRVASSLVPCAPFGSPGAGLRHRSGALLRSTPAAAELLFFKKKDLLYTRSVRRTQKKGTPYILNQLRTFFLQQQQSLGQLDVFHGELFY